MNGVRFLEKSCTLFILSGVINLSWKSANALANGTPIFCKMSAPNFLTLDVTDFKALIASLPTKSLKDFCCSTCLPPADTNFSISVTSTPSDLANDFLCNTFNLLNSASPPTCCKTLSIIPDKSPVSANSLAFCKFNCLPVITEASISACKDDWKSNKLSDILSTVLKLKPNFLAWTAAFVILCKLSAPNLAIVSELSAMSCITATGFTLFCWANW